jgi:hypothetical protein
LICDALRWLDVKAGKRFPSNEDTEKVNQRWSKALNLGAKEWDIFPAGERVYHRFRAAYLRASCVNANKDGFDFKDYAAHILGDDDETTIDSYKRYDLVPGTLTKI